MRALPSIPKACPKPPLFYEPLGTSSPFPMGNRSLSCPQSALGHFQPITFHSTPASTSDRAGMGMLVPCLPCLPRPRRVTASLDCSDLALPSAAGLFGGFELFFITML